MENLAEPVLSCMADGTRSTRTVADLQNSDVETKEEILVFAKNSTETVYVGPEEYDFRTDFSASPTFLMY